MTETTENSLATFERLESEVRGYVRAFPTVFATAEGERLVDEDGRAYLDFFAGAGALNYGHNHPRLKRALLDYLASGRGHPQPRHGDTVAKRGFLERFDEVILRAARPGLQGAVPRAHGHQRGRGGAQAGPQGDRPPQRDRRFTNAFHGMTLGSLAITGNAIKRGRRRRAAGAQVTPMPYDGYLGDGVDTIECPRGAARRRRQRRRSAGGGRSSRPCRPRAACNVARFEWLRALAEPRAAARASC